MDELTGTQRKYLRGLAHHLRPVVQVGKGGVTPGLLGSVRQGLEDHELIKVKFLEHKTERRDLSSAIAKGTDSHLAGLVGNVAIFYRRHPDPERRQVVLPSPSATTA